MSKEFTSQAGGFMQSVEKKAPVKKAGKGKTDAKPIKADNIPLGYELKPESKSKRLNLLIRPTVYEAIKDKAKAEGVSTNEYINNLILKSIEG